MDALKRAETSKQGAAPNLSLEPIPRRPTHASQSLPDLAQHIDSLNADLAAGAPASRPAATPNATLAPKEDENRAAIRNAFAAKDINPPSRKPLWLTMGGLAVAAVGISAYVWYQLQSMNHGSMSAPRPASSNAAPSVAAPPPQYVAPSPPAVPIFSQNLPSTVTNATQATRPVQSTNVLPRRSPTLREEATSPAIRVTRSRPEPDANLQRGYTNLQSNSLDQARRDYEQALRNDPNNVDALLGLAAIAHRQGRAGDAERYQQRALEADPRDAGAQAAILSNSNDPQATESRLKTLLAAQPESAPLNFALGNLYARQNHWNEAQQFYFNAVAGDTDNPDYLFNLAVSLDQLRQPTLAAQHYRMALEASDRRPGVFDRERVTRRLTQLTP